MKNPQILLHVVQQINQEAPGSIHLIFAGSGALQNELRERAKGDEHVHFIGFQNQSQMPIVYRLANVYCLPSINETWGLAVNEALACGRPVIASDKVGCATDLIVKPIIGSTFLSQNMDSLRKSIIDQLRKAPNGKAERQAFIQKWSFQAIAQSVEAELIS